VQGEQYKPGVNGPLIYFNGGDDIDELLSKVSDAGGSIIMGKAMNKQFSGYVAMFIDSEGNRMAIHSFVEEEGEEFS
jgi:predicted enzyme related to lactoylglutathione lyase